MTHFSALFQREFMGYFRSPVAYVFTVIFLFCCVGTTFFLGNLYDSNQASLEPFFSFLPWLYLVLVPAVGMRLWAEERRSGTIELLFTLPVTLWETVLAKFAAGWAFLVIALSLSFPLVLTVNYLGAPDNGVIVSSYLGGFLLAGAFLAISCFSSALTKNQVVSFILGVVICFVLVLLGWGVFTDILSAVLPIWAVDAIAGLGVMPHVMPIFRGVVDSRDLLYFFSVIVVALGLNTLVLAQRKAA